jgi:hypothetical protein
MTNAISKNTARQESHFAYVDFGYANINGTSFTPAIELPAGAVVVGGALTITTGFGAINVTVGDESSNNRYLGTTSAASTGRTPLVPTGYTCVGVKNLGIKFASAPSGGAGRLEVEYYVEGRATSSQG